MSNIRHIDHLNYTASIITMSGAFIAVAADIAGWFVVPGYNPLTDTISDLAAGRMGEVMDFGIICFAVGVFSIAVAMPRATFGGSKARWVTAGGASVMAILIFLIAVHNAYGDNEPGGLVIHTELAMALAGLFTLTAIAGGVAFGEIGRGWRLLSFSIAGLWTVGVPVFRVVPTFVDGAVERGLGILLVGWVVMAAWLLNRSAVWFTNAVRYNGR